MLVLRGQHGAKCRNRRHEEICGRREFDELLGYSEYRPPPPCRVIGKRLIHPSGAVTGRLPDDRVEPGATTPPPAGRSLPMIVVQRRKLQWSTALPTSDHPGRQEFPIHSEPCCLLLNKPAKLGTFCSKRLNTMYEPLRIHGAAICGGPAAVG